MQNLRKRPTYNEVVDYLENDQPVIKYPNRNATFLRNSPYLSQFDGDSWIDLEEQENNINKEKLKEMEVKRIAGDTQSTAAVLRATRRNRQPPRTMYPGPTDMYDISSQQGSQRTPSEAYDDSFDEAQERLDEELDRRDRIIAEKQRILREQSEIMLADTEALDYGFLQTPDRPSAPPPSTPIAPRRLESDFQTPASSSRIGSTLQELKQETANIISSSEEKRNKEKERRDEALKKVEIVARRMGDKITAQRAKAEAIRKKKEEQEKKSEELFKMANKYKNDEATKIQAAVRGKLSREKLKKAPVVKEILENIESKAQGDKSWKKTKKELLEQSNRFITKIQAAEKGRQVRKRINQKKSEAKEILDNVYSKTVIDVYDKQNKQYIDEGLKQLEKEEEDKKKLAEKRREKKIKKMEEQGQASSSSGAVMVGNIKADNSMNKKHWEDMSIEKLREQASARPEKIKFSIRTKRETLIKQFHKLIDENQLSI